MRRWNSWSNSLSKRIGSVAGAALLAGALFGSYEIFTRFALNSSHEWANFIIQHVCVSALLLAAVSATWEEGHINVDFLILRLHGVRLLTAEIILFSIMVAICIVLCLSGVQITHSVYVLGSTSGVTLLVPLWIPYIILPLSMGLCALMAVVKVIDRVHSLLNLRRTGGAKC